MIEGQEVAIPDGIDPEFFKKMATHYGQVAQYQRVAAEKDRQLQQFQAQQQDILNSYVQRQMYQDQEVAQRAQQEQLAASQQRPKKEELLHAFDPYIKSLHDEGRVSIDELDEHKGLIAEYLWDQNRTASTMQTGFQFMDARLRRLEQNLIPDYQQRVQESAVQRDQRVQQEVAARPGYEDLKESQHWDKLKAYIANKVVNGPRDQQGRPVFDPVFDSDTMAEMWDAMQGQTLRQALLQQRASATSSDRAAIARAGGLPTSQGARPKPPPKKGQMTEEQDALNFTDPRRAIG